MTRITVYTGRINYTGQDKLDITIKSASTETGKLLAPVWSMVMGHKRGYYSDTAYTSLYTELMRDRYQANRALFEKLLNTPEVTLCCYCACGKFCHRHLAVDILEKIAVSYGYEFIRGGER